MKIKKIILDVIFIVIATIVLIVLNVYGLLEKYYAFALIPVLLAYFLGQYVERRFNKSE